MQRANEEQKLNHRRGVADKLDEIAKRNGDSNLKETARRKREKAQQLYDKRMAKIDGKDPGSLPPDDGGLVGGDNGIIGDEGLLPNGQPGDLVPTPADSPQAASNGTVPDAGNPETPGAPDDAPHVTNQKLTGRENALHRQLRNEQRKLAQRMETAERLWDAHEQTGDERLADAARAFEERALTHYEKALTHYENRMDAIADFQQRHGLPDMIGDGLPLDHPVLDSAGERLDALRGTINTLLDAF
jgi:hypothetical protein